jgi:thiamine-monophosphate kinase
MPLGGSSHNASAVTESAPLGEFELIARLVGLAEDAGAGPDGGGRILIGSGDDAAVTDPPGITATSVDALVEGVHFRRETAPLRSIGHKAIAAGLSDLAAMGATAGEAYVQLGVPPDLNEPLAIELGSGLAAAAAAYRVAVVGGDLTRAPVLFVAVTVVGHAASPEELVSRAGAEPGNVLVVTGELGGAAAGLLVLQRPELAAALDAEVAGELRNRQLEPTPLLAAGRALAASGATAMIDVSDGLGADVLHVARASGARIVIDFERVPVQRGVAAVARAAGVEVVGLVAEDGEDYELLATLPAANLEDARAAVEACGTSLTAIGEVTGGTGTTVRLPDGSERDAAGFDQLRR